MPTLSVPDLPDVLPLTPLPGVYPHPEYGEVDFSAATLSSMLESWINLYRQEIPLKAAHESDQKWADLVDPFIGEDGRLFAIPHWTPSGVAAWNDGQIRRLSPEVVRNWEGHTGKAPAVLVGVARAHNPYFKPPVMASLFNEEYGEPVEVEAGVVVTLFEEGPCERPASSSSPPSRHSAPPVAAEMRQDVSSSRPPAIHEQEQNMSTEPAQAREELLAERVRSLETERDAARAEVGRLERKALLLEFAETVRGLDLQGGRKVSPAALDAIQAFAEANASVPLDGLLKLVTAIGNSIPVGEVSLKEVAPVEDDPVRRVQTRFNELRNAGKQTEEAWREACMLLTPEEQRKLTLGE